MQGETRRRRTDFGAIVPARSRANLEDAAGAVRSVTEMMDQPFFPIVELYEFLDVFSPGAYYEVRTVDEMGDDHGLTLLTRKVIRLREDVYEAACAGDGFGRFTMCHELGHLLLHDGVALKRGVREPPIYMSSEWQSDTFAGALLMPAHLIRPCDMPSDLMLRFGVSKAAADVRLSQVRKATK